MSPLEKIWESPLVQSRLAEQKVARLVVAYSGGADSLALLHVAVMSKIKPVLALHINHGLHAEADSWQALCEAQCETLSIPVECISVWVKPSGSLEENARNARYAAFADFLATSDLLLIAHHADDQLETAFFNLLRGSAVPGVLGMPIERPVGAAQLFRPLLGLPRSALRAYCEQYDLSWVEDTSNLDTNYDRGYLRHQIMPVLEQRWPDAAQTLGRAVDRDNELRELLETIAESDLKSCQQRHGLSVQKLLDLSHLRRENLLRAWIVEAGFTLPTKNLLRSVFDDLLTASEDAEPLVSWKNFEIRRFSQVVYLLRQDPEKLPDGAVGFDASCPLMLSVGTLQGLSDPGGGLLISSGNLSVKGRVGGEKIQLNGKTRSLKKVLQEQGVPPWLRDKLPLIYCDDVLVAIPGIKRWQVQPLVAQGYRAGSDEQGLGFWFEEN